MSNPLPLTLTRLVMVVILSSVVTIVVAMSVGAISVVLVTRLVVGVSMALLYGVNFLLLDDFCVVNRFLHRLALLDELI